MNVLNHRNLLKKAAVFIVVNGVSSWVTLPALAQLNPHPSIFSEPPYSSTPAAPPPGGPAAPPPGGPAAPPPGGPAAPPPGGPAAPPPGGPAAPPPGG